MRFLGRLVKYLLWSVFSIIVFLLLVGLAKMKWDINGYISFLNTNDWSVFCRSQPATWADPFWPHKEVELTLEDMLVDEDEELLLSGLDVYDPLFEEGLNDLSQDTLMDEEDFGFVTDDTHNAAPTSSNTSIIQQLIDQRN